MQVNLLANTDLPWELMGSPSSPRGRTTNPSRPHVALAVADIQEAKAELERMGVENWGDPDRRREPRRRHFAIRLRAARRSDERSRAYAAGVARWSPRRRTHRGAYARSVSRRRFSVRPDHPLPTSIHDRKSGTPERPTVCFGPSREPSPSRAVAGARALHGVRGRYTKSRALVTLCVGSIALSPGVADQKLLSRILHACQKSAERDLGSRGSKI